MKWSQIKTLFIFSFLILDIYLLIQFIEKQGEADLGILERQESSIEEQLEADNISVPTLPEEQPKEPFISVRQKMFTEKDMELFDDTDVQKPLLLNKTFIISRVKEQVQIEKGTSPDDIEEMIRQLIIYPDDYTYWDWNEDLNILIFFQNKNDRPVYFNRNGMILVFLDDKNEVAFYTQTMLGEEDARQDKKTLIEPFKAIETIYDAHELHPGDDVKKVEIGFHTRVPLENGVQVFVPTWKVTVNDDKNYFVNAIEGFVFSGDEVSFITETLEATIDLIKESRKAGDKALKDEMVEFLERKIDLNRSGVK